MCEHPAAFGQGARGYLRQGKVIGLSNPRITDMFAGVCRFRNSHHPDRRSHPDRHRAARRVVIEAQTFA